MKTARWLLLSSIYVAGLSGVFGCSDDDNPITPENNPPTLLSVTAAPDTFHPLEISTITAVAEDPDGDELLYIWRHRHGESILEWVVATGNPAVLSTCTCDLDEPLQAWVIATVSDGKGGVAHDSVAIVVLPPEEE